MVYIKIIYIALNYKYTLYIEVAYTNYLTGNLNIYIGKTLVFNFSTSSSHPSANKKLYYNGGLFLNESIDPTSINL